MIDRAAGGGGHLLFEVGGGMNIEDRRKPQTAIMKVVLDKDIAS